MKTKSKTLPKNIVDDSSPLQAQLHCSKTGYTLLAVQARNVRGIGHAQCTHAQKRRLFRQGQLNHNEWRLGLGATLLNHIPACRSEFLSLLQKHIWNTILRSKMFFQTSPRGGSK